MPYRALKLEPQPKPDFAIGISPYAFDEEELAKFRNIHHSNVLRWLPTISIFRSSSVRPNKRVVLAPQA